MILENIIHSLCNFLRRLKWCLRAFKILNNDKWCIVTPQKYFNTCIVSLFRLIYSSIYSVLLFTFCLIEIMNESLNYVAPEVSVGEWRLVNGTTHFEGRLEFRFDVNDEWRSVCTHQTGNNINRILSDVCSTLGFPTFLSHYSNNKFGRGTGPMYQIGTTIDFSHPCHQKQDMSLRCSPSKTIVFFYFCGNIWQFLLIGSLFRLSKKFNVSLGRRYSKCGFLLLLLLLFLFLFFLLLFVYCCFVVVVVVFVLFVLFLFVCLFRFFFNGFFSPRQKCQDWVGHNVCPVWNMELDFWMNKILDLNKSEHRVQKGSL